jgi:hypothetical protein
MDNAFLQWVEDSTELPVIKDFDELMSEVLYAYEEQYAPIRVNKAGVYYIYKLAVGKNWAQYKEHVYKLNPGVYDSMVKFFTVWREEDNHAND